MHILSIIKWELRHKTCAFPWWILTIKAVDGKWNLVCSNHIKWHPRLNTLQPQCHLKYKTARTIQRSLSALVSTTGVFCGEEGGQIEKRKLCWGLLNWLWVVTYDRYPTKKQSPFRPELTIPPPHSMYSQLIRTQGCFGQSRLLFSIPEVSTAGCPDLDMLA